MIRCYIYICLSYVETGSLCYLRGHFISFSKMNPRYESADSSLGSLTAFAHYFAESVGFGHEFPRCNSELTTPTRGSAC